MTENPKSKREKKAINIIVGARIRARRELLRLSRDELAEKADVTVNFISGLEYGVNGLSLTTLEKMARALEVSCDYLVLGNEIAQLNYDFESLLKAVRGEHRSAIIDLIESDLIAYKRMILNE